MPFLVICHIFKFSNEDNAVVSYLFQGIFFFDEKLTLDVKPALSKHNAKVYYKYLSRLGMYTLTYVG